MSVRKQARNRTSRKPRSDFQRLSRRFMSGLLRSLFLIQKPTRAGQAGFVLPTTVLLLLVMTLTVGALTFRTASRTQSSFLAREQQVIDNIAAPAIDRAKAKLEYLFTSDTRLPGSGTPSSDVLSVLMLNEDSTGAGGLGISALGTTPYKLPDETPIDINGDGKLDTAWSFPYDLDADGVTDPGEVIAYSVIMDDAVDPLDVDGVSGTSGTPQRSDDIKLEDVGTENTVLKADNLIARNGPINTDESLSNCGGSREPEQGWLPISAATSEKNFQITTYVNNGRDIGRVNSAFELQQVRRASRGNRWGAWFKYDMEIYPGPEFNWNGAIHSDGNVMLTDDFRGHMISSHNSCLYSRESSQITMAEKENDSVRGIDVEKGDFQGQLVLGITSKGYGQADKAKSTDIHIFTSGSAAPKISDDDSVLTSKNDSIRKRNSTDNASKPDGNPEDIAVDPVELFSRGVSKHRNTSRWERIEEKDWEANPYNEEGRVINQNIRSPYLDDFYRADNRYGPNPSYGDDTEWVTATDDTVVNTTRSSPDYDKSLGEQIISTDPNSSNLLNEISGLDGYWERQSITNGMRVVVGQRLELGNSNGWNFDPFENRTIPNTDPLYPPTLTDSDANKQRQRVTLQDNLAAVQGMVVYHYDSNNGTYPLACVANTAHPGTLGTLVNSRTFSNYEGTGVLKTSFLSGEGTNGWEFSFPEKFDTETKFGSEVVAGKPLGKALRNLANFAGDPKGGAPSFTPVQDPNNGDIHPFPQQAMWGDYSILRRIFDEYLDKGTQYSELSFADKSALHSAACTLGLLAYNLDTAVQEYQSTLLSDSAPSYQNVGVNLVKLVDRTKAGTVDAYGVSKSAWVDPNENTELRDLDGNLAEYEKGGGVICGPGSDGPGYDSDCDFAEYYRQFTTQDWLDAAGFSGNDLEEMKKFISVVQFGNQIVRDRALGFKPGNPINLADLVGDDSVDWDPITGLTSPIKVDSEEYVAGLSCDPDIFRKFTNQASGKNKGAAEKARLGLALMVCGSETSTPVKYPSLYYLFPMVDHDHDGATEAGELGISPVFDADHSQPNTEEYILKVAAYGENDLKKYEVVGDTSANGVEDASEDSFAAIRFEPKAATVLSSKLSEWTLPTTVDINSAGNPVSPETMEIRLPDGQLASLSLLDKVMYNGREEMAVRVLDVDLGKLTRSKNGTDYWISDAKEAVSGILYAAREDAVREDSIVRPEANSDWTNCNSLSKLLSSACWMDTSSDSPNDPPLSRREDDTFVGISLKPVDFAPDPDRRPHGFRLNADLDGENGDLSDEFKRDWGFTFVTDNAAYIKGEFNPHTTNGSDTIEEFNEELMAEASPVGYGGDFYNKRKNSNTDEFATDTNDRWRVAEVLADSVSILSERFVDGSVEEGFIRSKAEVSNEFQNVAGNDSKTSFHNQQRPLFDAGRFGDAGIWLRTNGVYPQDDTANWTRDSGDSGGPSYPTPIWVGRNGESRTRGTNGGTVFYRVFNDAEGNSPANKSGVVANETIGGNDFVLPKERTHNMLIPVPKDLRPRVNATIISGLVPSRAGQSYGGLHNFPRFLEQWNDGPLFIQGAFLQLNFSTASTAPWDIDAWDPGDAPEKKNERIGYYAPPGRRWGYDVALQYSPAGPIAQRFVTIERPRSEHYRELPLEDPYVENLRCALNEEGSQVFAAEDCS